MRFVGPVNSAWDPSVCIVHTVKLTIMAIK